MNTAAQQFQMDEEAAHEAFERYAAAKRQADATLDWKDALAAGQAWREFLNAFLGPERHMTVDSNIVPFRRPR